MQNEVFRLCETLQSMMQWSDVILWLLAILGAAVATVLLLNALRDAQWEGQLKTYHRFLTRTGRL